MTVRVWDWGGNFDGELGIGNNTDSNVPVQVSSLTAITTIAAGDLHSLVLKNDGTIWDWGAAGQLGDGNNADSNVPTQVTGWCQASNSINEITEPLSISVFPNPVQTQLTISIGSPLENLASPANEVTIHVYDLQGRMITLPTTFTNTQAQLNTTILADGFYTLQITNNKTSETEVGKFVKQ